MHRMRGRGIPKTMPKRGKCKRCNKRGMKQWQPVTTMPVPMLVRSCMYCQHVERITITHKGDQDPEKT